MAAVLVRLSNAYQAQATEDDLNVENRRMSYYFVAHKPVQLGAWETLSDLRWDDACSSMMSSGI